MAKKEIKNLLTRGVEEIIIEKHFKKRVKSGDKLRVKFGIDPTAPDIHLGHTVALRKLKQFQKLGHKVILIIGDFTAQIGDPSGRDETRPTLDTKEIEKNMKNYLEQAGKVIDIKKAEVKYNSEWLKSSLMKLLEISKSATIQQTLRRNDFKKRMEEDVDITLLELLYPVLQGYDSVAVKADVEIGGTDQKFNLLMGRRVQRHFNQPEQDIMTLPLIEGTDGSKKMSKSYGNYIKIDEKAKEMFGKIMSVPDQIIDKYFELLTDKERSINDPYKAKLSLAEEIVSVYHSPEKAVKAKEEFIKVFSKKRKPDKMPKIKVKANMDITDLLVKAGVKSKSEAKRLINQGGVRINDNKKEEISEKLKLKGGDVLQIGKKRFFEIDIVK